MPLRLDVSVMVRTLIQGLAAGLTTLSAAPGPTGPGGSDALKAGASAERAGDEAGADAAYRRAWDDAASRQAAAGALRSLYDHGRAAPTVDHGMLESARSRLGPDFLLTETRNFVVLSDADQAWTRQRSAMLEQARRQYFRVMARLGAPVYPHEHKLLCILFKGYDRYRAFARAEDGPWAEWIAGYYSPRTNSIVFYNDSTSPAFDAAGAQLKDATGKVKDLRTQAAAARRTGRAQYAAALEASAADLESQVKSERRRMSDAATATSAAKTVHEAIHLLAFNTGLQSASREYPFWLSEGLATSFETDDPTGGPFGPDHPGKAGRHNAGGADADVGPMPLERLVGLTQVPQQPQDVETDSAQASQARAMYDQSRALFTYLYRYRRRELAEYFQTFLAQPPGPDGPDGPDGQLRLFQAAFGDPAPLERRLNAN